VDLMDGMYDNTMIASNDSLSNPANFMPPMKTSLFCAARCKTGGGNADVVKLLNFGGSAVAPNASFPEVLSRIS